MPGRRVFVYVQHLLGIGHLRRAVTVSRAISKLGHQVTLASGGMPVPGLSFEGLKHVQLPAAAAEDSTFRTLVDEKGLPIDEDWRGVRREILLDAWRSADPHALVFELFPFGRRQLRFELIPLLKAATCSEHRPVIVSSVRDILGGGQKDPARQDEMLALFNEYFDHVLVHGDPRLIPFERTFRHAKKIADRLHYTGYVVDDPELRRKIPESGEQGKGEVIVSAGGGAVGRKLLESAIRARPLCRLSDRVWRVLVGVNAGPHEISRLANLARSVGSGRVIVESARADFTALLENCAVSISQGGYNTVVETLQARARAVIVPFSGGAETEQALRASVLAERGLLESVNESDLDPATLALAVDRAACRLDDSAGTVDLRGAQCAASLVSRWAEELQW